MSRGGNRQPAPTGNAYAQAAQTVAPAPFTQSQIAPQVRPAPQVQPTPTTSSAPNIYQQSAQGITDAMGGARSAMAYRPTNVGAERVGTTFGYTPDTVAAQTAVGGMEQYFNPYTQSVIDASLADMERQRLTQQQQIGAQAAAAGAFGGSRQGLVEAETNRGFASQGGMLASQLRNQGFNTALGAAQQDVINRMNADLANQAARSREAEFRQSTGLQAQGMNQQAGLQAAMSNQSAGLQGANLRLSGAGQLGSLANTGFNMGNTLQQQQMAQGLLQQQMRQQQLNNAQQQFYGYANSPLNYVNMMNQSLSSSPLSGASTSQYRPGALDYLSFGAGLMAL
jgi:hypothetical protein